MDLPFHSIHYILSAGSTFIAFYFSVITYYFLESNIVQICLVIFYGPMFAAHIFKLSVNFIKCSYFIFYVNSSIICGLLL